ncbi:MAG: ABC transporter permease [Nitriliruptoraceae bacterium]|nr:ABC transporter permease [Nitriliruptoraceae bacterium]
MSAPTDHTDLTAGGPSNPLVAALSDGAAIAKRNVIKIRRVPEVLVFVLISPIMFVLLFAYVFGESIPIPGLDYREFLMAGIFTQTVVFGSTFTGAGLAEDMQKGIIDRFRSLPMSRSAVLVGRTSSDIIYNVLSVLIMAGTGLLIGWRVRGSLLDAIGGLLLLLAFAYAFSWIMAFIGLIVPSVEVVNNATFVVLFPATFISNAFVPSENLPGPLQTFAEWNPVSSVTQAAREAFGNVPSAEVIAATPELMAVPDTWALANPVAYTLIWIAAILIVFVPLSIWQYQRAASR